MARPSAAPRPALAGADRCRRAGDAEDQQRNRRAEQPSPAALVGGRWRRPPAGPRGPAILIERAEGDSLRQRSIAGGDDACTTVLCQVLQRLHRPRSARPAELVCLRRWFADLLQPGCAAATAGTVQITGGGCCVTKEIRPLHGDLHHDNVLDFGARLAGDRPRSGCWAIARSITRRCSATRSLRSGHPWPPGPSGLPRA